ncbi:multicopper oxidase family protein [Azospirillum picis]|uniref:FtsP/CotA-like multicopper oxidase with cupredoxin domain n=1 Tax=Azospirillum picis TaxID=488438 RepID=A0ABU0MSJ2_9PROT|nr:multicopper oxidase domain-containing protein [Azospirillum picis]MBP2302706.1 FtsP/CotA-like multicopper oxidase with cupredoxin domain [Azospirillum picis]MDQ0536457.1 FtsP/CotA-like multicopper oxidase with cupredoxin domain [Azospirillum picis]
MVKTGLGKWSISRRSALLGSSAAVAAAVTGTGCTQTTAQTAQGRMGGTQPDAGHAGHGRSGGLANVVHDHPGELGSRMRAAGEQPRAAAMAGEALPMPPVIRVAPGAAGTLAMRLQSCTVGDRQASGLRTYDTLSQRQYVMAPTLEFGQTGVFKVNLVNNLPKNPDQAQPHLVDIPSQFNTTNLHTHGLHVSPSGHSDNVYLEILPAGTDRKYAQNDTTVVGALTYSYALSNHTPGTFWYHPHRHGSVAVQVASGAAGALIVRGGPGTVDAVAGIAGVTEQVLLLQQVMLDSKGELPDFDTIWNSPHNGAVADWTVNGTVGRTLAMRPGEVQRWRIVNTGFQSEAKFRLLQPGASGRAPTPVAVTLIAMDGVNFTRTATVQGVYLPPGGRADILVRAPSTATTLQAQVGRYIGSKEDVAYGIAAGFEIDGVWQEADFKEAPTHLFQVAVSGAPLSMPLPSSALPAPAVPDITADTKPDAYRYVNFNVLQVSDPGNPPSNGLPTYRPDALPYCFKLQINAELFCPGRVMFQPPLGSVDQYYVDSPGVHVFHIHVNPFLVTEVAGRRLSTPMWRDTMLAGPQGYKALTKYTDYSGTFPIHCHILDHEDAGMMTNVTVVDAANPSASFPAHGH